MITARKERWFLKGLTADLSLGLAVSEKTIFKKVTLGWSLVVQWLRLHASTAGGAVLIPGWGTQILACCPRLGQKTEKKKK